MEHKCIIGQWWDYEDTALVTDEGLKEIVEDTNSRVKSEYKVPLVRYYDKRYTTELERFDYCPVCGKKINWAMLKERAKTQEKHA